MLKPGKLNVGLGCISCRRHSFNGKSSAELGADQAKALRESLHKMSEKLLNSLVVVNVVDPKLHAPTKKVFDPEFDQCHECEPDDEPVTASPTLSGTSWSSANGHSWSSIAS